MLSTQVQAVCDKLVEQPKNIDEQCRQLWSEIRTNMYLFKRKQLLKAALQSLPVSVAFISSFMNRFAKLLGNCFEIASKLV
jgi:secreted Zn-dependent insulinase-like peptidase